MSFQKSADSLRAKLHLGQNPLPLVLGVATVIVVLFTVVVAAALGLFSAQPIDIVSQGSSVGSPDVTIMDEEGSQADSAAPAVFVHVTGAVNAPGVYELIEGARVTDAVEKAGGFSEGAATDSLNLARVLLDGEQVVVPTIDQVAQSEAVASAGQTTTDSSAKVNINTATLDQLDALPGIGQATAEKIIADREANGPFSSPEDLKRVSGIGDKKYEELADMISVG